MALDVFVRVAFDDAGPFRNIKEYMLNSTVGDDGTGFATTVADAAALITALDAVTMDHIAYHEIVVRVIDTGAAANVAANNSVEAFHRVIDSVTGEKAHFIVPAWDDVTYDKLPNGALSTAYNAVAAAIAPLILNPKTGNPVTYQDAQNRSTKRGQRQFKP